MTDKAPEIRRLARSGQIKFTRHAIEQTKNRGLTIMQVNQMLKNCSQNHKKGDGNGVRVEGYVPHSDKPGMCRISAHVKVSKQVLVITVIKL